MRVTLVYVRRPVACVAARTCTVAVCRCYRDQRLSQNDTLPSSVVSGVICDCTILSIIIYLPVSSFTWTTHACIDGGSISILVMGSEYVRRRDRNAHACIDRSYTNMTDASIMYRECSRMHEHTMKSYISTYTYATCTCTTAQKIASIKRKRREILSNVMTDKRARACAHKDAADRSRMKQNMTRHF